jgi:hypothetical protein
MNITKVTKLAEKPNETQVHAPKEAVRAEVEASQSEEKSVDEKAKLPNLISFDPESVIQGIVMATILGPPKGRMARRRM